MNIYREISWKIHALETFHNAAFRKMSDFETLSGGRLPIINYIIKNGGCSQAEVADKFGISAPAITCAVKRLEKDGLITRQPDSANQRCNRLFATDEGVRLAGICREEIRQTDAQFYSALDDAECARLNSYLERIIEGYTGKKWDFDGMRALLKNAEERKDERDV